MGRGRTGLACRRPGISRSHRPVPDADLLPHGGADAGLPSGRDDRVQAPRRGHLARKPDARVQRPDRQAPLPQEVPEGAERGLGGVVLREQLDQPTRRLLRSVPGAIRKRHQPVEGRVDRRRSPPRHLEPERLGRAALCHRIGLGVPVQPQRLRRETPADRRCGTERLPHAPCVIPRPPRAAHRATGRTPRASPLAGRTVPASAAR